MALYRGEDGTSIDNFLAHIPDTSAEVIIFDVGSRDCLQAIEFYEHFPNAQIYAFECNPNTIQACRKNINCYTDRIQLIEGAVTDYDGEIAFYPINQKETVTTWKDGNPGASSLFKSNGAYNVETYVQDEIRVRCHRLDSVMKRHKIPRVDIMWIDLQGAELLALKGLGDYLHQIQYMHMEVTHSEMYTGQALFSETNSVLFENGFVLKNTLNMTGWQEDAVYENTRYLQQLSAADLAQRRKTRARTALFLVVLLSIASARSSTRDGVRLNGHMR
jgi:FkbM family methyltransferase